MLQVKSFNRVSFNASIELLTYSSVDIDLKNTQGRKYICPTASCTSLTAEEAQQRRSTAEAALQRATEDLVRRPRTCIEHLKEVTPWVQ